MAVLHELKVYIFIKPSQAAQAGHTHNGGNILCLFSWPLQIHQSQPCLSVVTPQLAGSPVSSFLWPIVNTVIALSCLTSSSRSQVSQFLFEVPISFLKTLHLTPCGG